MFGDLQVKIYEPFMHLQFSVAGDIKERASLPSSRGYRNKGEFIKTGKCIG